MNTLLKIVKTAFKNIFLFYYEGFKSMTVGKVLWTIIIIKLIIVFFVLRPFFFPNFLKSKFDTDEERSKYVLEELTSPRTLTN